MSETKHTAGAASALRAEIERLTPKEPKRHTKLYWGYIYKHSVSGLPTLYERAWETLAEAESAMSYVRNVISIARIEWSDPS